MMTAIIYALSYQSKTFQCYADIYKKKCICLMISNRTKHKDHKHKNQEPCLEDLDVREYKSVISRPGKVMEIITNIKKCVCM